MVISFVQELDRNEAVRQSIVVRSRQLLASNKSVISVFIFRMLFLSSECCFYL